MKSSWEVVNYLIEAKRDVESIMYIKDNLFKIPSAIRMDYINRLKDHFYIKCVVVIDEYLDQKGIKNRKEDKQRTYWKDARPIIKKIYDERDCNSAHIDDKFILTSYETFQDLINTMIRQLKYIKKEIEEILPIKFKLKFYPHDKILFRLLRGVDAEKEEEIYKSKYIDHKEGYALGDLSQTRYVAYDIKELRSLSKDKIRELAVVVEAGLNFYEAQQNLENFYVLVNYIHDENLWTFNIDNRLSDYEELKKLGLIDDYDRPQKLKIYTEQIKDTAYDLANNIWGGNLWIKWRNKWVKLKN